MVGVLGNMYKLLMSYEKDCFQMLSKYHAVRTPRNTRRKMPLYMLSVLIFSLAVLLTACSAGSLSSNTPTPSPTLTINSTLQKQGTMELQTFQQWIALV